MLDALQGLLLGLAAASLVVVATPKTGNATTCHPGTGVSYLQAGFWRGSYVGNASTYGHDNPDDAPSGANNVTCTRVSSIYLSANASKFMEMGWQISPNNDTACPVDPGAPQQPFLFIVKTVPGSPNPTQICRMGGDGSYLQLSTDSHSFKINDTNNDGSFHFFLDGNGVGQTTTADYNQGVAEAAGERHGSDDSAYADLDTLKYINNAGGQPWDNSGLLCDTDNDYSGSQPGGDNHVLVSQGGGGSPGC